MPFSDPVFPHNVQDAHPDGVTVAATSRQRRESHAGQVPIFYISAGPGLQPSESQIFEHPYFLVLCIFQISWEAAQGCKAHMGLEKSPRTIIVVS